jgi:hypothetical protein
MAKGNFLEEALRSAKPRFRGDVLGTINAPPAPIRPAATVLEAPTPGDVYSEQNAVDSALGALGDTANSVYDAVTDPFRVATPGFNADALTPAATGMTAAQLATAVALKAAVAAGTVSGRVRNVTVMAFQQAYNASALPGEPALTEDGLWGPLTKAALSDFESVPPAGPVYGPPSPATPPTFVSPAPQGPLNLRDAAAALAAGGRSPTNVKRFQVAWNAASGVPYLDEDGQWGKNTAGVVAQVLGQKARAVAPPTFTSPVGPGPSLYSEAAATDSSARKQWWAMGGVFAATLGLLAWKPWERGGGGGERGAATRRMGRAR